MKTSIPSDVWEKKKALIARLYKDEEWPLKQVIKQIRTEDFNPSETQLRSRLKKWRVTKPSRQIRKKPAGEQGDNNDEEDEEDGSEEMSPVETRNKNDMKNTTPNTAAAMALPTPPQSQHSQSENLAITREWYPTDVWVQSQQEQQQISSQQAVIVTTQPEVIATQAWTGSISAASPITTNTPEQHPSHGSVSQINTPVVTQFATHGLPAYDLPPQLPQQPSPANSIPPPQTTHVLSPTFVSPTYAMAPISYPQPAPPTTSHWPTGNDFIEPDSNPAAALTMQPTSWYTGLYDAAGANAASYYHGRAVNPVAGYNNPVMQHMPSPQEMGASYQVQAHAHAQAQAQQPMTPAPGYHHGAYDEGISVRPWRRATTSHITPEYAPGVVRVDRQGRQRKPVPDRKRKESVVEEMDLMARQQHHQEQERLQSMQQPMHPAYQPPQPQHPQYIAAGHPHPLVPHDIYTYAGHEQLLQRPLGH